MSHQLHSEFPMKRIVITLVLLVVFSTLTSAIAGDGNRLTYLDELNPYYPHKNFPKLITPQWVGEEGVECVVILAIDDMRDPKKYEKYLRPILIRLKQIDGRAPVSIMTCDIDPKDEQIQQWLAEGLSMKQVGYDLGLSTRTVQHHKYKIMQEQGIDSNAGLLQLAIEEHLIDGPV